jgi:IS5 family transposase
MADLGLDDYYVHVEVPKATMQISSTEEPDVYSASTINLWGRRLAGYSLAREVKAIIKLAFTRPKLLSLVMTGRKRQTNQLIRFGTLARQRERMKLLRAARRAARLLPPPPPPVPDLMDVMPPPPPPVPDFMDVEWAARVLPPPPVPDVMMFCCHRHRRRAARFLKPLPPVIPLMNGSIQ